MNEQAIDIVIRAKDEATKALKGIQGTASKMGGIVTASAKVAGVAFAGLTAVVYKGKQALDEDAQATFRLTKLLKTASKATDEQVSSLIAQAEALERTTVAGYDMIATTQSQLATFNLQASTIERLTPAILDYVVAEKGATASADDYRQMTNGLAQALNGNFASLTKSGFILDTHTKNLIENGTEAQKADAIYKVLQSTYKGFATDATQTAVGKQIMLNKALEDLSKEVATYAIPMMNEFKSKILEVATATLSWLQTNKPMIDEYVQFFKTKVGELVTTIKPQFEEMFATLKAFWQEHGKAIKEILTNIWEIAVAIVKNGISVISGVIKVFMAILSLDWKKAWEGIKQIIVGVFDFILDYIDAVFGGDIRTSIGNGLRAIQKAFSDSWKWISEGFTNMVDSAKEWGGNMIQMFVDGLNEKVMALKDGVVQIATTIEDYLGFHSPTKKGPGSQAHKWMPNLIDMLAIGLQEGKGQIESKAKEIATALASMGTKIKVSDIANTLVNIADKAKSSFSNVTDSIQSSVDKVKSLKDELKGINEQIQSLSSQRSGVQSEGKQALAERNIALEKEIATLKADAEAMATEEGKIKLQKLEQELAYSNIFLTTQEKSLALQQMNRSESQVILENMWKKMGELDIEIMKQQQLATDKQKAIKDEQANYRQLMADKTNLDNVYFKLYGQHIEGVKQGIRETISLMQQLNNLGGGGMLSGARATGGSVNANEPYLVGERGPEIVIPKSSSTVVPNNQIGGGANISINFGGVTVRNDGDIQKIAQTIENSLTRKMQLFQKGIA